MTLSGTICFTARRSLLGGVALSLLTGAALAQSATFEPLKPLDLTEVNPAMAADLFGPYDVVDASKRKTCRIVLKKETTIGGMEIDVAPDCASKFAVMGDITAWRVMENWTIDLSDALCKTRVRFQTPDDRYVAIGGPNGINGLDKVEDKPARQPATKK